MQNILVTGGAGFIGSHLCQILREKEPTANIISLDNYSTGSYQNHIAGVNYINGDTSDIFKLMPVGFDPTEIYHLGEYSRVEQSFTDINTVWQANMNGTFEVLQYAVKHGAKLLYAGSSTKFGDKGLSRTQSPYGWTKAANTELCKNFSAWYGLNYVTVYFYNGYGPREISTGPYATIIARYKEAMRNNKPLNVVRPGSQKRNFTHVNDLVNGIYLAQKYGSGDGYGIGAEEDISILELANLFGGKVNYIPERQGNRLASPLYNQKIKSLGWRQTIKLVDYIEKLKINV